MTQYLLRYRIFAASVLVLLGVLGGRLAYLQLASYEHYQAITRGTAIRQDRVPAARGAFYDREGRLLVGSRPAYTLRVTPRFFVPTKKNLLADLAEVPDSLLERRLRQARAWSAFRPSPILRDVPFDDYGRVQENLYRLPGVDFEYGQKRSYPAEARAAHAFGYLGEISGRQLQRLRGEGYRMGDRIGQTGLEKYYEPYLRGRMGSELRLVNIHGTDMGPYRSGREDAPPVAGYDLHLTLHGDLQAFAERLFGRDKRGGAVALNAQTGGILAIVSEPGYDPALFSGQVAGSTWSRLTRHWSKPMLNRATMSRMPPGSAWKPFMALMALEEGLVDSTETYFCPGYHPFGGPGLFGCMHHHGAVAVVEAIEHSCNTFFFEMMMRADVEMLSRYGHMFGFGETVESDLSQQVAGLMPDSAYFRRKSGVRDWGKGWTLSLGIGQGDMAVTPLQMARYVMAVANEGMLYAPHLARRLEHPRTGEVTYPSFPESEEIPIQEEHFETVRLGMKRVMEAGTGYWVQIPGIASGGKTGTAQNSHGEDHSIFIMFAPYEDPQIALAVMVENAGYGSTAAGPIASLMAEYYLRGELSKTPETRRRLRMVRAAESAIPAGVAARREGRPE